MSDFNIIIVPQATDPDHRYSPKIFDFRIYFDFFVEYRHFLHWSVYGDMSFKIFLLKIFMILSPHPAA